jgi:hypothetical protein
MIIIFWEMTPCGSYKEGRLEHLSSQVPREQLVVERRPEGSFEEELKVSMWILHVWFEITMGLLQIRCQDTTSEDRKP